MRKGGYCYRIVGVSAGVVVMAGMTVLETWKTGGSLLDFLPILLAASLHEMGHLTVALACRVKVKELRLDILGARMRLDGLMSYGTEWLIAAGGPLVNLLSAAVVLSWWRMQGGEMTDGAYQFAMASLALGFINLLPVGTLDGGRMIYCATAHWKGSYAAAALLRYTSSICLSILWLCAGYALIRTGGMLTFFIFVLCLLLRVSLGEDI